MLCIMLNFYYNFLYLYYISNPNVFFGLFQAPVNFTVIKLSNNKTFSFVLQIKTVVIYNTQLYVFLLPFYRFHVILKHNREGK